MSAPTNNFKLGLFILGGVTLLIVALVIFGARGLFEPRSLFETYIEGDVTGLSVGSTVELRGVRVGKIKRIDFSWSEYRDTQLDYVVIVFEMRDDVAPIPPGKARSEMLDLAIKRGLRARLRSQGVTGTSILSIEYVNPDENPVLQVPWTPNHTYIPAAPSQFGELLGSLEKTLHNLQHLEFSNINQLVQHDLKSAGQVLDNAGRFDFGTLSTNANLLLTDLRDSNIQLKTLLANTDDTVKKLQLEKLSQHTDDLIGQLQTTLANLQPGLAGIDFEALNQTLENARRSLRDIDDVLSQLKQYPSGFIFGNPPRAVKAVQSPSKP
jgi:ABC-type transporter Mla subunit MlaD